MPGENPYAPPQTLSDAMPLAPRSFGWEVAGNVVRVKQTVQFPMIDPFTGGSADSMTLYKKLVRYRPRWLWLFPIIGGACSPPIPLNNSGGYETSEFFLGMIIGWMIARLVGFCFPVCTLRLFFEKRTQFRRNIISRILAVLLLVGFFGGFVLPNRLNWIAGVSLLVWLVGHLISSILYRGLRCNSKSEGRFEIRGFHPRALTELSKERLVETHFDLS